MDDIRARADARLEQALADAGVADPRPACRDRLKALRAASSTAFARAVDHFEHTLVPAVAGGAEPLGQWIEYARILAEAAGPGRTVMVDARGRARPYRGPTAPAAAPEPEPAAADLFDAPPPPPAPAVPAAPSPAAEATGGGPPELVLFLPNDTRRDVLPLQQPRRPSPAQQATLDLLVHGRREP